MARTALKAMLALGVPLVLSMVPALPAGAAHKVGPNQYFTGVVNATDGNTDAPIPIQMACFGPVTPGETGHPLAGQTLAVDQLFPPAAAGTLGKTGNDSTIDVFFGAPPPAASGGSSGPAASTTVSFTHYDKTKKLPKSLTLPCSGTGTVWFVPVPVVPPSQAQAVPVQFDSQP